MARMKYVLAFVVLLIIGGVYFFINSSQKANSGSSISPPQVATVSLKSPATNQAWRTYTNSKYHYSIDYPADWAFREYPDTPTGAGFRPSSKPNDPQYEYINIDLRPKLSSAPLDQYVKTAASSEIQSYQSINQNNRITTASGIVGYETIWNVVSLDGSKSVSLPITYFSAPALAANNTVQVSLNSKDYLDVYNKMLTTFKYTQ